MTWHNTPFRLWSGDLDEEMLPNPPTFAEMQRLIIDCMETSVKDGLAYKSISDYEVEHG